jgi:hypothetical protein
MGCHQAISAEQTARYSACERPPCPQWHLLGSTIWGTLAATCLTTCSVHHLLQSFRSLATSGVWASIMNALADSHDAAVQMIDTSIVRVHQHGACITRNRRQSMGRSRGGLTSKIYAVVDTNGLPVRSH